MKLLDTLAQLFASKDKAPKASFGETAFGNPYHLFAGPPFREYNPSDLVSRKGLTIYDKMRRDDQIKAAMSFKKHSILAGGWDIVSPEMAPEKWKPAELVEKRLKKIEGGFENTLLQLLTALDYGYSITERVWKDDNGAYLAALKTRAPHQMEFISDVFGNVTGLEQNARPLPMDKFVLYSYATEFSNHYGTSDLEAAYRAWWTKDNAYKWMAMLLERMGIPPIFALYNADDYKGDQLSKLKTIMLRMQAATTGIIPRGDKDSMELWSPELAGQVSTVFIPAMDMFNRDIARAILMPGLLGATPDDAEGSYARAQVHFDVFMLVIEHVRRELQELVNAQIVAQIVAVEVGPLEEPPRFEFRPLTDDVRIDLMESWGKMVDADIVKRQGEDEKHIRKQLKFPEREAKDEDFDEPEPAPPGEGGVADDQIPSGAGGNPGKGKVKRLAAPTRSAHFEQVARRLDALEAQSKDKLKGVLAALRDVFIADLPKKPTAAKINDLKMPGSPLEDSIASMLLAAFGQGRKDVRTEVNPKPNAKPAMTPKAAIRYLREKALWVKGITEEQLLKDAKAVLLQSLHNGEGTAETVHKLQDVWLPYLGDESIIEDELQLTAPRLETIVRTNTTDAYNNGRLVEMRDPDLEGFIHGVEYSAIIDERTTELCQHLDRKIFRIDDVDIDRFTPPNHYNCRSILVPIMVDEPIDVADLITATDKGIALDLMDKGFGGTARFAWDESQHPRVPAGSGDESGQFGPGGGGGIPDDVQDGKDNFGRSLPGTAEVPFHVKREKQTEIILHEDYKAAKKIAQIKTVRLSSLIATEGHVDRNQTSKILSGNAGKSVTLPLVASYEGSLYIMDGHHRLSAAKWKGDIDAEVRLIKVGKAADTEHFTWDESQHPRDDQGQWTDAGGGSSSTRIEETLKERALKAGQEKGIEHASVINEDGEVIIDKDGDTHYVEFTEQEISEMRGSIVLHNHPNQTTLSEGDLRMTNSAQLREIVAVTEDGGVYRGKALMDNHLVGNAYTAVHFTIMRNLNNAIASQDLLPPPTEFTLEKANMVYGHAANTALSKIGAIAYDAQLGKYMKDSIASYNAHSNGFEALVDAAANVAKGVLP
jgi:SPP1 gp7 family putative phage head morphogenesis protein